jgi:hypothetical protein
LRILEREEDGVRRGKTYDGADGQEPNYDGNDFLEKRCIGSLNSVDLDVSKELDTDVKIEDGGAANGSEPAYKDCLTDFLNLWDAFVHCKDDGNSTEKENEYSNSNEPWKAHNIIV